MEEIERKQVEMHKDFFARCNLSIQNGFYSCKKRLTRSYSCKQEVKIPIHAPGIHMITKEEKCISSAINSLMKCADWS